MTYSIVIAQFHYQQDVYCLDKITKLYHDANADIIITPFIPGRYSCSANYYLAGLLDLTLQQKTYLLVDGRYNNSPDNMLLIGQGKILKVIARYQSINVLINETTFNFAFDTQNMEDNMDAININIMVNPYPVSVLNRAANTIYINPVGGYGDAVFMGQSYVTNMKKEVIFTLEKWQESVQTIDSNLIDNAPMINLQESTQNEEDYKALMIALRDYVNDHGFKGVILGLSGGIDSALSMVIAADALGPDRVHAIMMPSRYTSDDSLRDAYECAKSAIVRCDTIPIEKLYIPILDSVRGVLHEELNSISQENVQARVRGIILMTMSNQLNKMVLATGNKSEAYTGYCTLYGDTCGGYAILKDVYKTQVYALSHYRNANIPEHSLNHRLHVIPSSILDKAPTAELKFNQKDNDTLPDYEILDKILWQLIDKKLGLDDIISNGYDADIVKQIAKLVINSEYKRKQSPSGPIISASCEINS